MRAVANTAGKEGMVGSGGVTERVDARSEVVTVRVAEAVALISGEGGVVILGLCDARVSAR
jgi:hypothetical protein